MTKVSVAMVTYNHEKFISKALDSILMQHTDFEYEIVVGDDYSTDNTRTILRDYQKKYPHRFRLLLNEENLGLHRNSNQVLKACKGKYVANLEGDDYWTSHRKLQKQVDFLDIHPECSACFHDALIVQEDGSGEPTHYRPTQKAFSSVEDLLLDNFIPTCSVMYRRGIITENMDWVGRLKMGDWPTHIFNALHGTIGYIDETMAVYLVHPGGIWSMHKQEEHEGAIIELYEALMKHLEPGYTRIIDRILRYRFFAMSKQCEGQDDLSKARTYAVKALKHHLSIAGEPLRYGTVPDPARTLPNYMKSFNGRELMDTLLRLYPNTLLRLYVPSLHRSLKMIVKYWRQSP